jgi:ABC-2 type transport system permease protein
LLRALRKWARFYVIYFADALVYRANAVIWLLTDTFPAIIMPLLWLASYNGRGQIGGYTPSHMVIYYMIVLFLSSAVESHIMWDMATLVKDGSINSYLTRPFSFAGTMYAMNVSWRLMRSLLFVPLFCIVLAIFHRWVQWQPDVYDFGWKFWLATVLGHFVSFFVTYAMGLLALYFVDVSNIFYFYYLPEILFNGQIAPLTLFPHWVGQFANFLPFPSTISFPAQVFIGNVHGTDLWIGYGRQIVWIVIAYAISAVLYRQGLRRYAASGI